MVVGLLVAFLGSGSNDHGTCRRRPGDVEILVVLAVLLVPVALLALLLLVVRSGRRGGGS